MIKLRTLLLCNYLYYVLLIISVIYSLIYINFHIKESIYKGNEKETIGNITDKSIDGNKLSMIVKNKEEIIVNYYIEDKRELIYIKNNYNLGDTIYIKGELISPINNTVFNLFNYKKYLYNKNIYWLFSAEKIKKVKNSNNIFYNIKQIIINRIEKIKHSSNYIKMFALGDKSEMNNKTIEYYKNIGISHLFAVSGMHIGLISIVILRVLKILKVTETKRYILVSIFLIFYSFLTGFSSSVLRATILFIFVSINKIFYFHIKSINLLFLTFITLQISNPYGFLDIGFQFSFIISFFIIQYQNIINKYKGYFTKLLIISFISFLASMPILIYNFFEINLISIIVNIFFVPYVSIILFPLSLITFILPFLDNVLYIFINIMEYLSSYFNNINILKIIISKPHLIYLLFYYLTIIYFLNKFNIRIIIPLLILLIINYFFPYFDKEGYMMMIDVGQGDSILIKLPNNKGNILIDTGGKDTFYEEEWKKKENNYSIGKNTLIPLFKSLGIRKIDYLIITHGDNDHIGESTVLVNNFNIKNVLLNKGNININEEKLIKVLKNKNISYEFMKEGILNINGYKLYLINNKDYNDENDNSTICYINIKGIAILFTGDISKKTEADFVNEYNIKVDILKGAHHGSNTSSSIPFLDKITPKIALISVGRNNKFNHPSKETIYELNRRKITTYMTSVHGSVKYIFDKKGTIIFSPP